MTSNKLRTRIAGHRSFYNRLQSTWEHGKTAEDQEVAALREKTALLDHAVGNQHKFAFDQTQILDSTFKKQNLPILEMCHITNTSHTVNKRTDTDSLSKTYAGILHNTKRNNTTRVKVAPNWQVQQSSASRVNSDYLHASNANPRKRK